MTESLGNVHLTNPTNHAYLPSAGHTGPCLDCGHRESHLCHLGAKEVPLDSVQRGIRAQEFFDEPEGMATHEQSDLQPTPAGENAVSAAESGKAAIDLGMLKRDMIRIRQCVYIPVDVARHVDALIAEVEALQERVAELTLERDLAVAHDQQPYPTVEAYGKACEVLTRWKYQAEAAEAREVELAGSIENFFKLWGNRNASFTRAFPRMKAALASTPTEALKRARAKDEAIKVCRTAIGYIWPFRTHVLFHPAAKDSFFKANQVLANLDAHQPAKEDARHE